MQTEMKAAINTDLFVTVPETTLPCGIVVPAFMVGKYATSQSDDGKAIIVADRKPWTNINYHNANAACIEAGYQMITETQWLAIAHNVANVDANWTKGKVGEGKLFRGIREGNVSSAQAGDFEPTDKKERRWLTLSNGEQICDLNGNVFSWVFDDLHGDEKGVINKSFDTTDPSISTAPYPTLEKGMGWRPNYETSWSGVALVRGGYWLSGDRAGVFRLSSGWPVDDYGGVGFRCTKSL
ncbi:SUMF1/EgtB/PvdO family nonheme iron enzyme [Methylotenera oryzisoli]|nr:SUMF1/EgtB/PvdO family nonheme iron enzyme [Methylotenera oryzisoli]